MNIAPIELTWTNSISDLNSLHSALLIHPFTPFCSSIECCCGQRPCPPMLLRPSDAPSRSGAARRQRWRGQATVVLPQDNLVGQSGQDTRDKEGNTAGHNDNTTGNSSEELVTTDELVGRALAQNSAQFARRPAGRSRAVARRAKTVSRCPRSHAYVYND